jgi:hypothetical protein
MMKPNWSKFVRSTVVVFSALAFNAGGLAWGESPSLPTSAVVPSDQIIMSHTGSSLFNSSGLGRTGSFFGTLVEESCDSGVPPGTQAVCDAGGTYYALAIDGQSGVYTLMPGVQAVRDELVSHPPAGRRIEVTGVAYPATGAILASSIRPSDEAREETFSLSTR